MLQAGTARTGALLSIRQPTSEGTPRSDPADNELVQRTLEGDRDAFEGLVRRYEERAWWAAFHLLGDGEEARDIAQEAFLRAYKALARFDFGMSFYTWLYRIVVNLSIDALRKRSRLKPLAIDDIPGGLPAPPENEKPSDRIEGRETAERVRTVLAKLPEKYRTVMSLRELDNLSCKEIAAIVRSTHATVRWRLHIARRMFKEHWERLERARREGRNP
jgi:RNA polymerase sigma-70 factor, ECF subfamily